MIENHVFYRDEFQKQRFHPRLVKKRMTLLAENPGQTKGPGRIYIYGDGTLMVSASQRLLWRVRPEKKLKRINVADGSIGSIESMGSIGYIGYIVHTGNIPVVK